MRSTSRNTEQRDCGNAKRFRGAILGIIASLIVSIVALGWFVGRLRPAKHSAPSSQTAPLTESPNPHTLAELLALSPSELKDVDIARMNLLCAEGLPQAENLNVDQCLATLDQWAQWAKSQIDRHMYRFRANPGEYENSEGYFKMLMMAVVVYEDFAVRYNPQWIAPPSAASLDDHFFANSSDVLLHGLTGSRHMGTCSSMPVLYVALGRRLGFPLKLVSTKGHLFLRWEGQGDRFDLEATGKGMNRYDDEHFKQWPFPITEEEMKADGYLKSMTPAEELSVFLTIRAMCLREAGRMPEAIAAHAAACKLVPEWRGNQMLLADAQERYAGTSAATVLTAQPVFQNHQQEVDFAVWQAETLSRLKRAELGIPENRPAVQFPNPTVPFPKP